MDVNSIGLFNVMKAKIGYLSERQSVLAKNVANADMPGYSAMDLPEPNFKKMAMGSAHKLQMVTTDPKHVSGSAMQAGSGTAQKRKTTFELSPSGNNVVIEEEMANMADNQAEYAKVTNLYGKMIGMFKTAIGRPTGG